MNEEIKMIQSELKALDGEKGYVEGYASVFNSVDSAGDTIHPDAYKSILESGELPKMFFNHDAWGLPIGKWTSMEADGKGLLIRGQLNLELDEAKDIYSSLKFGSLNGLSVRILYRRKDVEEQENGTRLIKSVLRLPEVSIVTIPCEQKATLTNIKSLSTERAFENALRDLGASHKEAMTLISQAKRLFGNQRDSDNRENANKELAERLNRLSNLKMN